MERLKQVKQLLGITGNEKDTILMFLIEKAMDTICNYCHTDKLPEGLETTFLSIVVDLYRLEGYGKEEVPKTVTSISEGDTSLSFGALSQQTDTGIHGFLKDYVNQLNQYRKMRW